MQIKTEPRFAAFVRQMSFTTCNFAIPIFCALTLSCSEKKAPPPMVDTVKKEESAVPAANSSPETVSLLGAEKSPGFKELKSKMAEVAALGCIHVLHPPVSVKGTVAWAPRFPEDKDGACLNLLAATGNPNKPLTALIRTPSGETVHAPNPGPVMDFLYCAKEPGQHPINVTSPSNEMYTFAAVDCPHDVAMKRLGTEAPASQPNLPKK